MIYPIANIISTLIAWNKIENPEDALDLLIMHSFITELDKEYILNKAKEIEHKEDMANETYQRERERDIRNDYCIGRPF